jgi:hypothetical protein
MAGSCGLIGSWGGLLVGLAWRSQGREAGTGALQERCSTWGAACVGARPPQRVLSALLGLHLLCCCERQHFAQPQLSAGTVTWARVFEAGRLVVGQTGGQLLVNGERHRVAGLVRWLNRRGARTPVPEGGRQRAPLRGWRAASAAAARRLRPRPSVQGRLR